MDICFPQGRPQLSAQALSVWAKSVYRDPLDQRYLQLWQHMEDTGAIASWVWDDFIADDVKTLIAEDVGSLSAARNLYIFVSTIHDVGKASPAFEVQVSWLADKTIAENLVIRPIIAKDPRRSEYRHELVGYASVQEWLLSQCRSSGDARLAHGIASIVAGHHGTSITGAKRDLLKRYDAEDFIGDDTWRLVRYEMLDWAADLTDFRSVYESMGDRPMRRRSQILITAMVIIADWIASNDRLFPLNESSMDEDRCDPMKRAAKAWHMLRLPQPWHASASDQSPDEMFAARFDLPGARLRPVQREAVRMAQAMEQPGLMIIEANMGEGKTEAALIAAEILASRFHCGGVYYALPSQATVNAMFTRVLDWIGHLPAEDRQTVGSLFLAHGKSELNDKYEALRERWLDDGSRLDADFSGISLAGYVDGDVGAGKDAEREYDALQAVVNSWLTGRKRGNLSDFVVGTIDQILMAGLRSKHVVLRHLALAGKVVILDEIHSNTAYMNVYMETILSWMGAYGVPVIMLSATLPQDRRRAFLQAYRDGAKSSLAVEPLEARAGGIGTKPLTRMRFRKRPRTPETDLSSAAFGSGLTNPDVALDLRYPLLSLSTADRACESVSPASSGRSTDIRVSLIGDDDASLLALLQDRLREGGCAVVIRDTVARAQHAYDFLREHLGSHMDVGLAHSRFLAFDRARIDRELIHRYGKHGDPSRRSGIIVATQVVEQSLDVDFDLMVTDIAPIDLILQRAGRLHRHHRGDGECDRPRALREAELIITGVEWKENAAPAFMGNVERVYPRYLLMRSLAVLGITPVLNGSMNVPDDIPRLVQTVYGPELVCPETWRDGDAGERHAKDVLDAAIEESQCAARQFRILQPQRDREPFMLDDWLSSGVSDPDSPGVAKERDARAGVRESEDSFEVIVLHKNRNGDLDLPSWGDFGDSSPLPNGIGAPSRRQVRDMLSCTIALSRSSLAYLDLDSVIAALEESTPPRWYEYMQQSRDLRGQLLVVLDQKGHAEYPIRIHKKNGETITMLHLRYSTMRGLEASIDE